MTRPARSRSRKVLPAMRSFSLSGEEHPVFPTHSFSHRPLDFDERDSAFRAPRLVRISLTAGSTSHPPLAHLCAARQQGHHRHRSPGRLAMPLQAGAVGRNCATPCHQAASRALVRGEPAAGGDSRHWPDRRYRPGCRDRRLESIPVRTQPCHLDWVGTDCATNSNMSSICPPLSPAWMSGKKHT
jgi:hypothetical protein